MPSVLSDKKRCLKDDDDNTQNEHFPAPVVPPTSVSFFSEGIHKAT